MIVMKCSGIRKNFRAFALVLSLVVMTSLSTSAQPNSNNNNNARGGDRTDTTRVVERDNDTDWGWLGLLGLLGLAGLIPKKRTVEVQEFRDVDQSPPAAAPRNNP